jgi:starch synthase (maltosyl-transferring)
MSTGGARRDGRGVSGSEWDVAAKRSATPAVLRDERAVPSYAIEIEHVEPQVEGGRYDVKRAVGDVVEVSATIFKDGHDVLGAAVLYRATSDSEWIETPMAPTGHVQRWAGRFQVDSNERYVFTVEAWVDRFATWRRDMKKRLDAAQDVTVDFLEGVEIARHAAERADPTDRARIEKLLERVMRIDDVATRARVMLNDDVASLISRWQPRVLVTRAEAAYPVWVDRRHACFASWYEFFPRSEGAAPGKSGSLRASEARLV